MNDSREHGEEVDGLRFFGTVTASTTHELRNIIATIEQVMGLLEDHVASLQAGQAADPQRLSSVGERVARQTRRAGATIDRLNAFAHTVDEPVCQFDARELLANLLAICERLANLRKVELVADFPPDGLMLRSRPFVLQQLLFVCLRGFWEAAPMDSKIKVTLAPEDGGVRMEIAGPAWPSAPREGGTQEHLARMTAEIAASMESKVLGSAQTFTFRFCAAP